MIGLLKKLFGGKPAEQTAAPKTAQPKVAPKPKAPPKPKAKPAA